MMYIIVVLNSHFFFPACENVVIVNQTYGILESIGYPNPYSENQHCNWTIQATTGNTVNYTFLAFDLEYHINCSTDYLEVCIIKLNWSLHFQVKLKSIILFGIKSLILPHASITHQPPMVFKQVYFIFNVLNCEYRELYMFLDFSVTSGLIDLILFNLHGRRVITSIFCWLFLCLFSVCKRSENV